MYCFTDYHKLFLTLQEERIEFLKILMKLYILECFEDYLTDFRKFVPLSLSV